MTASRMSFRIPYADMRTQYSASHSTPRKCQYIVATSTSSLRFDLPSTSTKSTTSPPIKCAACSPVNKYG